MKRVETLRGRGVFSALYREGSRLDGESMRCFFRCEEAAGASMRAGFSVSGRLFGAVTRNRLKRLMRAAFDAERSVFDLRTSACVLAMVFVFRGSKTKPAEELTLHDIRPEMAEFLRRISAVKPGAR